MSTLQTNAMLTGASVILGGLLGERKDNGATQFVADKYGADEKRVKASKYLINRQDKAVKAVVAAAQRIRAIVYKYTLAWGQGDGLRLLPVKAHSDFKAKIDQAVSEFWDAVRDYVAAYPRLVRDAETDLDLLFDASQYPRQDQIRDLFKVTVEFAPIPDGKNFIADIAADAADEAKSTLTRLAVERSKEAINEVIFRVETGMGEFIDKLAGYKTDPGTDKVVRTFRDSAVKNVDELGKLIRKLNFADDPGIDNLATQVERIGRFTGDALRDDKPTRDKAIAEAQSLVGKLDSYRKTESEVDAIIGSMADYMA